MPTTSAGVVVCHCADCQKLHGNSFALFTAAAGDVQWEGREAMRWYRSSGANERAFCETCGSRLAKRPVQGDRVMVSAGLFPVDLPRTAVKNLWLEHKPAWVEAPQVGPLSPEAFLALALGEPIVTETAQYGYALRAASGNRRPPGIIALTWIAAADVVERERIRAHSRQNVQDFLAEPGFISIVTGFTGLRGFTVTAWEDEAAMKRALGKHHAVAMKELFGERFVASVWTSVWAPTRMNRLWVRCPVCGSLEDASDDHRTCGACGAAMPERPAFW
jgi:quinol monooxygenase YgiN